jgi:hypothetical protein
METRLSAVRSCGVVLSPFTFIPAVSSGFCLEPLLTYSLLVHFNASSIGFLIKQFTQSLNFFSSISSILPFYCHGVDTGVWTCCFLKVTVERIVGRCFVSPLDDDRPRQPPVRIYCSYVVSTVTLLQYLVQKMFPKTAGTSNQQCEVALWSNYS